MAHKCDGCRYKGEHQEMKFRPIGVCNRGADLAEAVRNYEAEKCPYKKTNADRIRPMSDEEMAEFLTHINPTNCQDCAFSHGWRCHPDRDDYSDFEKCKEGRKRWLQQPAEEG